VDAGGIKAYNQTTADEAAIASLSREAAIHEQNERGVVAETRHEYISATSKPALTCISGKFIADKPIFGVAMHCTADVYRQSPLLGA